jgi:hypothetical protein
MDEARIRITKDRGDIVIEVGIEKGHIAAALLVTVVIISGEI